MTERGIDEEGNNHPVGESVVRHHGVIVVAVKSNGVRLDVVDRRVRRWSWQANEG